MKAPDFYLASSEGYGMEEPRKAWRIKRLATDWRDDLLLVRIDPPLQGQSFGLGDRNIDLVMLAPRHKGYSLFPIDSWPAYVHVICPLIESPEIHDQFHDGEYELMAWAELYPSEGDARIKKVVY